MFRTRVLSYVVRAFTFPSLFVETHLHSIERLNRISGSHGTTDDEDEAKEGIASIIRALKNERPPEVSVQASS